MPTAKTSILEYVSGSLTFSTKSIADLVKRLEQHGLLFRGVDLDRSDGRSMTNLALDDVEALDASWTRNARSIKLRFEDREEANMLSVEVELPTGFASREKIKVFGRGTNHGLVLAGLSEVRGWQHSYPGPAPKILSQTSFWFVASIVLGTFISPNLAILSLRNLAAVCSVSVCLFMYLYGCRRFFPLILVTIGSSETQVTQQDERRSKLRERVWDVIKIVLAAVLGAALKSWFDSRK